MERTGVKNPLFAMGTTKIPASVLPPSPILQYYYKNLCVGGAQGVPEPTLKT